MFLFWSNRFYTIEIVAIAIVAIATISMAYTQWGTELCGFKLEENFNSGMKEQCSSLFFVN